MSLRASIAEREHRDKDAVRAGARRMQDILSEAISSVLQVHEIDEVAFAASKGGTSASLTRDRDDNDDHHESQAMEIIEVIDDVLDPTVDEARPLDPPAST